MSGAHMMIKEVVQFKAATHEGAHLLNGVDPCMSQLLLPILTVMFLGGCSSPLAYTGIHSFPLLSSWGQWGSSLMVLDVQQYESSMISSLKYPSMVLSQVMAC
ncbi:hypothetical protein BS47DRAFT_1367824 [Hydnum rufescens UP504]|uniref:Uncharacterized protein n=1 Tax=Hydnum rufescens UP504 TaxID=1448309 RepID=A0A9P6AH72_9AGAM|nr:hypothetical protein BS47DRAFT_1367824 [Hydnum rufescens UP504]